MPLHIENKKVGQHNLYNGKGFNVMIKIEGMLKTTWTVEGPSLIILEKSKSKTIPIANIQSCNHKPPGFQGRGTIEVKIAQSPTGAISVGGMTALFANDDIIVYKRDQADNANRLCAYISNYSAQAPNPATASSDADELRKFKELFEDGIISQEEFDTKKKQLLGL